MKRFSLLQRHPFPFLQYLEWGLLAIAFLGEFFPPSLPRFADRFPLLNLVCLIGFAAMGLRLPTGAQIYKILYTVLEFGLILLIAIAGKDPRMFPFLYVVVVIRSCLIFQRPGRLVVTGIAYFLFLMVLGRVVHRFGLRHILPWELQNRPFLFNFALLLGLVLVMVLLLVNALITERQSREKLAIANDRLRHYAMRIENLAMVQERNRIAREIHDSLGHALTGLNLQLEGALKLWQSHPEQARQFLHEAKQSGSTALSEVRRSVSTMRSDPLQGKSLHEVMAMLTQEFQRTTGIQPDCQIQVERSLSAETSTAVYRILQEALTNIRKHANATQVKIGLNATVSDLRLEIIDNGSGFNPEQNRTGFGLQGMHERAIVLGGKLEIQSCVGQGCCIVMKLPLL